MKKYLRSWPNWVNKLGLIFALSIVIVLYLRLGRDALFDWDEGIYATLGKELLSTKNIFVSFWNGSPWLEKPPGITWVAAIGIWLAGPTALGARLLMPLFAAYTLYIVYKIGTHLGSWKHGLIAAGILATFNLFLGRTRAVNTDMPLLAGISTSILFLLEGRPSWWVALAVFGSVWFKGIAGLLSVIISLPLLLTKSRKYWFSFIFFSLIFIAPWHLYVYLHYGSEFLKPYFFEQVVQRATAQIEFHFETRWYYFSYLWENLGLGTLLIAGIGSLITIFHASNTSKNRALYVTILWWVLAPLCIFTLAKTRLFWYILPIYPALALLVASAIGEFQKTKIARRVMVILAIGIWIQALSVSARSVEIKKSSAETPDRLYAASQLGKLGKSDLAILVPPSERSAEALLPQTARLSSSFRYGGMPAVVFYYPGHVQFFYNVDKFRTYWSTTQSPTALISVEDKLLVPSSYQIIMTTPTYLGIQKGVYAFR